MGGRPQCSLGSLPSHTGASWQKQLHPFNGTLRSVGRHTPTVRNRHHLSRHQHDPHCCLGKKRSPQQVWTRVRRALGGSPGGKPHFRGGGLSRVRSTDVPQQPGPRGRARSARPEFLQPPVLPHTSDADRGWRAGLSAPLSWRNGCFVPARSLPGSGVQVTGRMFGRLINFLHLLTAPLLGSWCVHPDAPVWRPSPLLPRFLWSWLSGPQTPGVCARMSVIVPEAGPRASAPSIRLGSAVAAE